MQSNNKSTTSLKPRFRVGQRVRIQKLCYYPAQSTIPKTTELNRYAHIRKIHHGGTHLTVEVTGYPHLISYTSREIVKAA